MEIRGSDWHLIAISIAVGIIMTIVYDVAQPCLSGLFDKEIRNFTCSNESQVQIFAGLVAFFVGFVYLLIFKKYYKNDKTDHAPIT